MQTEILATRTWINERLNGVTDPYAFTVIEDGTILAYNADYGTKVVIPDTINGVTVTGVTAGVFNYHSENPDTYLDKGVVRIVCPTGEFEIGDYAFAGCSSLYAVLMYGDCPVIGSGIFDGLTTDQVTVYRLAGTDGWYTTLGGMPVVEVDDFQSVIDADRPKYLRDTVDNKIHEIRITNGGLTSGLIQ